MDRLSPRALEASNLGMSYGKYIAMLEQQQKKEEQPKTDEGGRKCILCGRLLPSGKGRRRYCGAECAEKYRQQQAKKRCEAE